MSDITASKKDKREKKEKKHKKEKRKSTELEKSASEPAPLLITNFESTTASTSSKKERKKDKSDKQSKSDKKSKKNRIENGSATTESPSALPAITPEKSGKKSKKSEKSEDAGKSKKRKHEERSQGDANPRTEKKQKQENNAMETEDNANENGEEQESGSTYPFEACPFFEEHKISVEGGGYKGPLLSVVRDFPSSGYSSEVLRATQKFEKPTPIQAICWPVLNSGSDIIGVAETGSGKTIAFGLPSVTAVLKNRAHLDAVKKPGLCVVAPTRELAQQTHDILQEVSNFTKLKIACIYGGVPKDSQRVLLNRGVHIIVGCPGRILDLANDGSLDLSEVSQMVLDEADRMLDMGFEGDIRKIFSLINKKRQVAMFSATWPLQIRALASEFLRNAVKITIGSKELAANVRILQLVEVIEPEARDKRLLELLIQYRKTPNTKVLIFALYKNETVRLEQFLQYKKFNVCAIHGNLNQAQRNKALESFKLGNPSIMIATDVAARGLHIPQVEFVINYSFPLTIEDYVHRIGRTGRAGMTGTSHTFFQKVADKQRSGELIGVLRKAGVAIPQELLACGTAVVKKEPKLGKIDTTAKSQSVRLSFSDSEDDSAGEL